MLMNEYHFTDQSAIKYAITFYWQKLKIDRARGS